MQLFLAWHVLQNLGMYEAHVIKIKKRECFAFMQVYQAGLQSHGRAAIGSQMH